MVGFVPHYKHEIIFRLRCYITTNRDTYLATSSDEIDLKVVKFKLLLFIQHSIIATQFKSGATKLGT